MKCVFNESFSPSSSSELNCNNKNIDNLLGCVLRPRFWLWWNLTQRPRAKGHRGERDSGRNDPDSDFRSGYLHTCVICLMYVALKWKAKVVIVIAFVSQSGKKGVIYIFFYCVITVVVQFKTVTHFYRSNNLTLIHLFVYFFGSVQS